MSFAAPTLVVAGSTNPFMRGAAEALANALPNGQARMLEGHTHDIVPSALGPVLKEFLAQREKMDQAAARLPNSRFKTRACSR